MLRSLMLAALVLASTVALGSLFSANASDQIVKSRGFVCKIRDLGCHGISCCAAANCTGHGVTSGWVKQCYEIQIPLVPL